LEHFSGTNSSYFPCLSSSSNSPYDRYSNTISDSRSTDDLRRLRGTNATSSLRVDTKFPVKKAPEPVPNQENLHWGNKVENAGNPFELGNLVLKEGAELERLNYNLLDLAQNRMNHFMNSVKQFVSVSGRLAKCVHPKAPDVEPILRSFTNQKATIENNLIQMVKTNLIKSVI